MSYCRSCSTPSRSLFERHARDHPVHADLISEIVELRAALEGTTSRRASESLREPLTETELRVLRLLLATDLSKREIGNELYVSVNTIKTHVKHLYAKLDVQTRRQAVERGRRLGLAPPDRPVGLVGCRPSERWW